MSDEYDNYFLNLNLFTAIEFIFNFNGEKFIPRKIEGYSVHIFQEFVFWEAW